MRRAAAEHELTPAAWAQRVVRRAAHGVLADAAPEEDRDEPGQPEAEPDVAAALTALRAGLAELVREVRHNRVWGETLYAELVAHTGFSSSEQERACRARAGRQLESMRDVVAAYLARRHG